MTSPRPTPAEALGALFDVALVPALIAANLGLAIWVGSALNALAAFALAAAFTWLIHLGYRDEPADDLRARFGLPALDRSDWEA